MIVLKKCIGRPFKGYTSTANIPIVGNGHGHITVVSKCRSPESHHVTLLRRHLVTRHKAMFIVTSQ